LGLKYRLKVRYFGFFKTIRGKIKEIPLDNGPAAKVDDEDYGWLSAYSWYAYCDSERGMI
jgi:hypothetical protein